MHRKALLAVAVLSLVAIAGCAITEAPARPTVAIPPTGESIVVAPAQFSREAILSNVRTGMTPADVVKALGRPKGMDRRAWFYTWEYPHAPACLEKPWASILLIEFRGGKVAGASWVPQG